MNHVSSCIRIAGLSAVCSGLLVVAASAAEPTAEEMEALRERVAGLEESQRATEAELEQLRNSSSEGMYESGGGGYVIGNVRFSGDGAVAFFDSGSEGNWPNGDFKLDDTRLEIDAKIMDGVYFYTSLMLAERERDGVDVTVRELFLELDNLSGLWGADGVLSLRLGRTYIPFGEEYIHRHPMDNPLISHSYSDIWGVDEGITGYGRIGMVDYVIAVQNGGYRDDIGDQNSDKAVTIKIGVEPRSWLRLSASAMRTGTLDPEDRCAAIWFGNHFISPLNLPSPTQDFEAEVAELDVRITWDGGHVAAAGGWFGYEGEPKPGIDAAGETVAGSGQSNLDILYYYVEAVQDMVRDLYGGVRFSQVDADDGYLLFGQSDPSFGISRFTTEAWRLSVGLGYRFGDHVILKAEYSAERGTLDDGRTLDDQDLFGLQAAFSF